jgi:hypothetical protein
VATSTGWPALSIGTDVPNFLIESSVIVAGMSGVQIGPGATAAAYDQLCCYTDRWTLTVDPDSFLADDLV